MNVIRITMNIVLSGVLVAAGLYLLSVDFCTIHGILFIGLSRHLLSASLLLMAAFSGVIAAGWIRGTISKPPPSSFAWDPTYVDPVYKGELIVRYWYLVVPALICAVLAFAFAANASDTALHLSAIPLLLPGGR